jgi:hypothetical protein
MLDEIPSPQRDVRVPQRWGGRDFVLQSGGRKLLWWVASAGVVQEAASADPGVLILSGDCGCFAGSVSYCEVSIAG